MDETITLAGRTFNIWAPVRVQLFLDKPTAARLHFRDGSEPLDVTRGEQEELFRQQVAAVQRIAAAHPKPLPPITFPFVGI